MVDARTTSRWYILVAMGRKAGHLALGIGKAAGATLTLIPEEFPDGPIRPRPWSTPWSGPSSSGWPPAAPTASPSSPRRHRRAHGGGGPRRGSGGRGAADSHGHLRIAEVAFGDIIKQRVQKRLGAFGVKATVVAKNIGYELRCADPIPYDMDYARDLGYCAAKYLIEGGNASHGEHVPQRVPRHPLRQHHGPGDGAAIPRPHGQRRQRSLHDRPPLHAPPAPRRLQRPQRPRQVRRRPRHHHRAVRGAVPRPRRERARPPPLLPGGRPTGNPPPLRARPPRPSVPPTDGPHLARPSDES